MPGPSSSTCDDETIGGAARLAGGFRRLPAQAYSNLAARLRKRAGVVDQIGNDLSKPRIVADNNGRISNSWLLAPPSTVKRNETPRLRGESAIIEITAGRTSAKSTGLSVAASEFSVEPGCVRDIADQAVEPTHIVLHDRQ